MAIDDHQRELGAVAGTHQRLDPARQQPLWTQSGDHVVSRPALGVKSRDFLGGQHTATTASRRRPASGRTTDCYRSHQHIKTFDRHRFLLTVAPTVLVGKTLTNQTTFTIIREKSPARASDRKLSDRKLTVV